MKDNNLVQKIQPELVKQLYQQISFAIWAESFAAIGLAIALWGAVNQTLLITWLLFNLIFCGLARHILVYFHRRSIANLTSHSASFWLTLFIIGVILSGISWGATGSILMVKDDTVKQTFQVFLLIGVTAAANPFYSPYKRVYALFLIPAFLPFVIWLVMQGGIFIILGVLAVIYIIIMLATSSYSYKLLYSSLLLRYKNSDLVMSLFNAKSTLEKRSLELEQSLSLLTATLESTTDGILVIDSDNLIEDYNKRFIEMFKLTHDFKKNYDPQTKMIDLVSPQLVDPGGFIDVINNLRLNLEAESFDEINFKDGRVFERHSQPQMLGNECVGRVWSFHDITGRKLMESKLFHQAHYDSLTELPNRALVNDRISQAINYAERSKSNFAILFIDLDRFKMINDTLGHKYGDKLLKEVAERLLHIVRHNDTVSRSGGDEFLIVLTLLKDENDLAIIANKLIQEFNSPFYIDNHKFSTTISIGISLYPKDGQDAETLIRNADIAMYRAKEIGRNNFQFFTEEMNLKIQQRSRIENELRDALIKNQLFVLYQPIVNLENGCIIGAEALLRWSHPRYGEIQPNDFISIAEESGLITIIGEWVLRKACEQAKKWHDLGFDNLYISVNISPRQFKQENLFEIIHFILEETHLRPSHLVLELTESVIMDEVEKNITTIQKLKRIGVMIAIDDFGIGYSSLNYLKQLPVDKLKIDISFIKDIDKHADGSAITAAIIALAEELNLKVIAEGVESESQLLFLIQHKCNETQGYYFSKPLTEEAFLRIMQNSPVLLKQTE